MEQGELLRQQGRATNIVLQDMFLPRRTTYVFSMQGGTPDEAYSVLPILVTRSKGARLNALPLHPLFMSLVALLPPTCPPAPR